jgi:hypothetical protein
MRFDTVANATHRLASRAFLVVFQRRQTRHGALIASLEKLLAAARISNAVERQLLECAITQHD